MPSPMPSQTSTTVMVHPRGEASYGGSHNVSMDVGRTRGRRRRSCAVRSNDPGATVWRPRATIHRGALRCFTQRTPPAPRIKLTRS
jgi:hypothetical protein